MTLNRPTGAPGVTRLAASFALSLAAMASLPSLATAADANWPTRPVRVVSAFSTGSGPDAMLRLVADRLSRTWGQQVVVENKPGGSGFIAANDAKRATPDGNTLFHADGLNFTAIPHMYKKLPYDPVKDFMPVIPLHHSYFFVAVAANSPWKTAGDMLAAAKAKPGTVTYGSWQIGSVAHLGGAQLEAASGTRMTHVPFKDNSQLYTSVANGEVDWAFGTAGSAGPLQKAGKLRFLALAGPERLSTHPDVPTIGDAGGPKGFEASGWVGLFAPAGTPPDIVDKINRDIAAIVATPDMQPRMMDFGYMPLAIKPADVRALIDKESAQYAKVVKTINLSLD
ncbi:Bug family tripartite tricarboxylate transporter substrate binding protein [Pigmentiphaga litoralis]|uniref:Tripartite-type tricarboxylate transporter receptor subunit TctC n=1 Tax=Pigmentiphaga litoralis TaxID=516702 RepID=A0A7Y9IY90_9BURK|nr:tripartite tricarboxylate transporter substrate binding protein [Pigmentiphaga litoralis]NYE26205.1 tripartite-type tricarboxylate transporter receptor subunit TctC [Pigmentiphaga litoralis]NYE85325.1 tripartite-type tricarboxylate transporter receptor subunit TctC [Pigmentiphaga litoralis]